MHASTAGHPIESEETRSWRTLTATSSTLAVACTAWLAVTLYEHLTSRIDRTSTQARVVTVTGSATELTAEGRSNSARPRADATVVPRARPYSTIDIDTLARSRGEVTADGGDSAPSSAPTPPRYPDHPTDVVRAEPPRIAVEQTAAPRPAPSNAARARVPAGKIPQAATDSRNARARVQTLERPQSETIVSGGREDRTGPEPPPERIASTGAPDRVREAVEPLARPQNDATSARLDDFWERRERWLSERLQRR